MTLLVHDKRPDRRTPVAAVELTEADLREYARILAAESQRMKDGARTQTDRRYARVLGGDARRLARVADELRQKARKTNGAATAGTAPRHDPQEVIAP